MKWLLTKCMYLLARFFHFTYRYRFVGIENLEKARTLGPNGSYILGIWHQNLFAGILAQTGLEHVVIASKSKDSEAVSYTLNKLGHVVLRGSSKRNGVDKGGKAAKDQMIEVLKSGKPGSLTVDGPKGPAQIVKPGIIDMAKKTGAPLIPYIPVPEKYWSFNSWDKFRLPKPFSKIIVYYGEPLMVDGEATEDDFDKYRDQFKDCLIKEEFIAQSYLKDWKKYSKLNIVQHTSL